MIFIAVEENKSEKKLSKGPKDISTLIIRSSTRPKL
jgi:hypothetical protein